MRHRQCHKGAYRTRIPVTGDIPEQRRRVNMFDEDGWSLLDAGLDNGCAPAHGQREDRATTRISGRPPTDTTLNGPDTCQAYCPTGISGVAPPMTQE